MLRCRGVGTAQPELLLRCGKLCHQLLHHRTVVLGSCLAFIFITDTPGNFRARSPHHRAQKITKDKQKYIARRWCCPPENWARNHVTHVLPPSRNQARRFNDEG